MRMSYALVLVSAAVGTVLGAMAYLSPSTGVDGTPGALLALIGAVAVTAGALLAMMPSVRGWARGTLNVLIGLGAGLVAVAAYFLMQYPFAMAMGVALLGLFAALAFSPSRRTA